jgi:hypothetical protein
MAAARRAESARLAAEPTGPSPMPKDTYDADRGDLDLTSVTAAPIDGALRALAGDFAGWDVARRRDARGAISMDELYTLLAFAKRASALALKESSPAWCEAGLVALAMIDEQRIDWRDAAVAAGLLAHGVAATGGARDEQFTKAIALATPGMGVILDRARHSKDLSGVGYAELRTGQRVGLIQRETERYEPTLDLTAIALGVADTVNRSRYVAYPTIATRMPPVWFAKERQEAVRKILEHAHGTVSVTGTLRGAHNRLAQMLFQWIAELPTAQEAEQLLDGVGPGTDIGGRLVVGVACGRLFALVVAGSNFPGTAPIESRESLARLANETRVVLESLGRDVGG